MQAYCNYVRGHRNVWIDRTFFIAIIYEYMLQWMSGPDATPLDLPCTPNRDLRINLHPNSSRLDLYCYRAIVYVRRSRINVRYIRM